MIREKLKQKMLADPRLKVPMYRELPFWLDQDCQEMIELVNNTNNIAVLLFDPVGALRPSRLGFNVEHELHELNECGVQMDAGRIDRRDNLSPSRNTTKNSNRDRI